MEEGEDYIAAGPGREQQKRKPRKNAFTAKQKAAFLEHFAGSCNVQKSCKHAGVVPSTVYRHRAVDARFRQGWEAAQATGYATLEAELVRRGLEFVSDVVPDEASSKTLAGMDARLILTIVQQQGKKIGQKPGDIRPKRSDLSEATDRLSKLLKRMKLEVEQADREGGE